MVGLVDLDLSKQFDSFVSLGIGGSSPISGRENDSFGAGWYYLGLSSDVGQIANTLPLTANRGTTRSRPAL